MIYMLVAVGLFFGAIFGFKAFVGAKIKSVMANMPMPPVTVSTVHALADTWTPTIPAVGSLRASRGVDVTSQVAGQIIAIHFESGGSVKAGDPLLDLYAADEQAQLQGLVADRKLAELNLGRAEQLIRDKLISAFELDTKRNDLERAKAAEDALRLQIREKSVRAPFAGRVGIRQVDLGQYLQPGNPIVRLESGDQMLVDFPVAQQELGNLKIDRPVSLQVDAWPGQVFHGRIMAIEPQVDPATRNIKVRAVVDNADGRLLPGMFARIEVELPAREHVVTVPQAAILKSPYGDAVFVVGEQKGADGKPELHAANAPVVTGSRRGDQVAIVSGLAAGATVVSAGLQKLRNGSVVLIDNSVPVSNNPAPQPVNN